MRAAVLALAVACACGDLRSADRGADDAGASPSDAGPNAKPRPRPGPDPEPTGPGASDAGRDASTPPEAIVRSHSITAIALDAKSMYYASSLGIFRCPKDACSVGLKLADTSATRLAIANGNVFWTDPDGKRIASCTSDGCIGPTTVVADQTEPDDVATDGAALVWEAAGSGFRTLRRAAVGGGSAVDVTPTDLARRSIAVGAGKIVWCALDGMVRSCPLDAACPTPVVLGSGDSTIAIFGTTAFWGTSSAVVSCPLDRACDAPKTVTVSPHPANVVADDTQVYWRDLDAHAVLRCPLAGCAAPEVFATGVDAPVVSAIAIDTTHVYWNTAEGIVRAKK